MQFTLTSGFQTVGFGLPFEGLLFIENVFVYIVSLLLLLLTATTTTTTTTSTSTSTSTTTNRGASSLFCTSRVGESACDN